MRSLLLVLSVAGCDVVLGLEKPFVEPGAPWGTPMPVPGNPIGTADDPSLTEDMLELFFDSSEAIDGSDGISVIARPTIDVPWGAPVRIMELSTADESETTPEITPDGLTILFSTTRPGSAGGADDIWKSTRDSRQSPWKDPVPVNELNTSATETGGSMTRSARSIVVARGLNDTDILLGERASATAPFGAPVTIDSLMTEAKEQSPFLTSDGLSLYFTSDRNGEDDVDIYLAVRSSTSEPFEKPEPVSSINTARSEDDPWVSPDGRTIYFVHTDASGVRALWYATR